MLSCSPFAGVVESAEEASPAQLEKFRAAIHKAGAQLLISFHNFSRTRARAYE